MTAVQKLEALEKQLQRMMAEHIALEAKVLVVDSILGFLMQTGHHPPREMIAAYWNKHIKDLQEKYPGVQFQAEVGQVKPTLYIPSNGSKVGS